MPQGSVDDGKRALAQLEVDVSPLRANKGGSLRGGRTQVGREADQGSVDFYGFFALGPFLGCLGRFLGCFLGVCSSKLHFLSFWIDFWSVLGGFGGVLGGFWGCFFDDFANRPRKTRYF